MQAIIEADESKVHRPLQQSSSTLLLDELEAILDKPKESHTRVPNRNFDDQNSVRIDKLHNDLSLLRQEVNILKTENQDLFQLYRLQRVPFIQANTTERFMRNWNTRYKCDTYNSKKSPCRFSADQCCKLHASITDSGVIYELFTINQSRSLLVSPFFMAFFTAVEENHKIKCYDTVLEMKKEIVSICNLS